MNRVSQTQGLWMCCQPGSRIWCLHNSFLFMSQSNSASTGGEGNLLNAFMLNYEWPGRQLSSGGTRWRFKVLRPRSLLKSSPRFSLRPCGDMGTRAILPVSRLALNVWLFKKLLWKYYVEKNKIKYVCGLLCNDSSNGWPDILLFSEPIANYTIISMVSSGEPGWVTHDAFPESLKTYTTWQLLTLPTCHGLPHGTMLIATKINK